MAEPNLSIDPGERYASLELAYTEDRWPDVLTLGESLINDLRGRPDPLTAGLVSRAQLLLGHAHLYGLRNPAAALVYYQAVLAGPAEPDLQEIAAAALPYCQSVSNETSQVDPAEPEPTPAEATQAEVPLVEATQAEPTPAEATQAEFTQVEATQALATPVEPVGTEVAAINGEAFLSSEADPLPLQESVSAQAAEPLVAESPHSDLPAAEQALVALAESQPTPTLINTPWSADLRPSAASLPEPEGPADSDAAWNPFQSSITPVSARVASPAYQGDPGPAATPWLDDQARRQEDLAAKAQREAELRVASAQALLADVEVVDEPEQREVAQADEELAEELELALTHRTEPASAQDDGLIQELLQDPELLAGLLRVQLTP
mgnify:FL=1|jgi:hypothetical protein